MTLPEGIPPGLPDPAPRESPDPPVSLDLTNQKLLDLLVENGRASYAELGRRLHLTRAAVRERVAALMRFGVIERFTTVIDPEKLGFKLSFFFEIDVEPSRLEQVGHHLALQKHVVSIYQMTGPSRLHLHALLRDARHLEEFMSEVYGLAGITRVDSHLLLKRFKNRIGIRI